MALNYGSKEEIINACKNLFAKKIKEININTFKNELYTKNIPDPDLLIRTGDTKRLSNFLLWQLAYSEIFFDKKFENVILFSQPRSGSTFVSNVLSKELEYSNKFFPEEFFINQHFIYLKTFIKKHNNFFINTN